jgi:hypothetical protein
MINQFPDAITKDVFQNYIFQPPSLQSYVKQILFHLAQQYPTPASRATILNLKNNIPTASSQEGKTAIKPMMDDDDNDDSTTTARPTPTSSSSSTTTTTKVTLSQAEDMLERLLDEQWLMQVEVGTKSKKRRSTSSSSSSSTSNIAKMIVLGPRAWGELSYLLSSSDESMEQTRSASTKLLLPQPIYIRY